MYTDLKKKKIHFSCAFKCNLGCKWAETEDSEAGTAVSRKRKCSEVQLYPLQVFDFNTSIKLIKVVGCFPQ